MRAATRDGIDMGDASDLEGIDTDDLEPLTPDEELQFLVADCNRWIVEHGAHLRLDGEMRQETQALALRLGTRRFDLNRWWVLTPVDWSCPSCGRPKADIARIDRHERMMGHLHAHHDHMQDFIVQRLHAVSSARAEVVADENCEQFAARAAPVVSAYDPTVICADCNSADAAAKKALGLHPAFSFSPADIGRFVVARPNHAHELDFAAAARVWEERKAAFELRLALIEQIVKHAADNEHWYQYTDYRLHPDRIEQFAKAALWMAKLPPEYRLDHYIDLARRTPRQNVDLTAWRKRKIAAARTPTQSEIDHVARVTHGPAWRAAPDDWACPGCGRTKAELVRPSNKFKWSFDIDHRPFSDGQKHFVCQDCAQAHMSVAKEAGVPREAVSLDQLRCIVRAAPHRRHQFDSAAVDDVVRELTREAASVPE
ncbi:MAG TPA: hypothetical protein VMH39_11185 [Gemmatimonadaceae bacterium]|nr:hypothetical protein [Gemmatimonadaceae bacterium]